MIVYIVIKNGEVDCVFDNEDAAVEHRLNLQKKWNLTKIIVREVQMV